MIITLVSTLISCCSTLVEGLHLLSLLKLFVTRRSVLALAELISVLTSGTGQNTVDRASLITSSKSKSVCQLEARLYTWKTKQLSGSLDVRDFDVSFSFR